VNDLTLKGEHIVLAEIYIYFFFAIKYVYHYQKIKKYKQTHQQNIFVGILW